MGNITQNSQATENCQTTENSQTTQNCKCKKSGAINDTCVICHQSVTRPMFDYELRADCQLHRVIMMCGHPEFVCKSCDEAGWYSTAGWGGGTQHINRITGKTRYPRDCDSS
jgi:hypothetical protein